SFLLGSSRGAAIGLVVCFIVYIFFSKTKNRIFPFILIVFLLFGLYNLANIYQSGLFERLSNLSQTDDNNLRFKIYRTTFDQFANSPFLGGSIQNDFVNHFPHNIYLEALTATGIFGFLA